jgi:GTP-binding protein Era
MNNNFKSGYVTLVGRPNAGKSTLMNTLIGEKLAIISSKPQTTRNKIQTILTTDDFQIVFTDTPGIHKPATHLGEYMLKSIESALKEIDIVLYLVEPFDKIRKQDMEIIEKLKNVKAPVFLLINKIDTIDKTKLLSIMDSYSKQMNFAEIIPISALKADNKELLLKAIEKYLSIGPKYFPEDMITDQPERQIVAEIIREKALYLLQDEIPHGIAVEVTGMKRRSDKEITDIDATIYCERESHKGIIIGKKGSMLKKIGSTARYDIEKFIGGKANVQLWIKVKKDWRDSDNLLKAFGYDAKKI